VAATHIMTSSALKLTTEREPLLAWSPTPAKAAYPKDYFVPNFGLDHDILNTGTDISVAEGMLSHKLDIDTSKKKGPPKNYFVPDFGMDHDIATSIKNEKEASVNMNHKWVVPAKSEVPPPPPTNYFVPNFGLDHDILNTATDIKVAEAQLGHQWQPDLSKKKGPPQDYFVPNFGMDHDIADSLNHLNQQEKVHGNWQLPESMVQLDSNVEREPLMANVGIPKKKVGGHPTNYFVPDFGMDEDIISTQKSIKTQKEKFGLKWPGDSFVQTDAEINREPLLTWSATPTKLHPMNYFVPDFGLDHDMIETKLSYEQQEKEKNH